MRNIDPDSEENQAASRQNEREVFALQMQAKYPNGITDEEVKLYDEIHADMERLRRQPASKFICDRHLGDPALDHAVPCLACLIDEERRAMRLTGTYTSDVTLVYVCRAFRYGDEWFNGVNEPLEIKDGDVLMMLGEGTWFALYRKPYPKRPNDDEIRATEESFDLPTP